MDQVSADAYDNLETVSVLLDNTDDLLLLLSHYLDSAAQYKHDAQSAYLWMSDVHLYDTVLGAAQSDLHAAQAALSDMLSKP